MSPYTVYQLQINLLNNHFVFFSLLYSPDGISLMTPAVFNQHILTRFPVYLFTISEILWWNLPPCLSETGTKFSGKIPNGNSENEVSMTC